MRAVYGTLTFVHPELAARRFYDYSGGFSWFCLKKFFFDKEKSWTCNVNIQPGVKTFPPKDFGNWFLQWAAGKQELEVPRVSFYSLARGGAGVHLEQQFSKYGPQTSSFSITWEPVRSARAQAPLRPTKSETVRARPNHWKVNKPTMWLMCTLKCEYLIFLEK